MSTKPKQTAIERLREYIDSRKRKFQVIYCKKTELVDLINAAIAEAEKAVDNAWDIADNNHFYIGKNKELYNIFEDWQEKEGMKL